MNPLLPPTRRRRPAARRTPFSRLALTAVSGLILTAAADPARAGEPPRYTAVEIGVLPADGAGLGGINNSGAVAGNSFNYGAGSGKPAGPFLLAGGAVTYLNREGLLGGNPADVNNTGAVAGVAVDREGAAFAGRWDGASFTELVPPRSPGTQGIGGQAFAINDSGLIVGDSFVAPVSSPGAFRRHAVSWNDGIITDLHPSGASSSEARGVNNAGVIVGSVFVTVTAGGLQDEHAAVWRDGVMTDLGTLGGTRSEALAINDAGWIVGSATLRNRQERATLWRDGATIDLGALLEDAGGIPYSSAFSINAAGDVLGASPNGYFLYKDGVMYDFDSLLIPGSPVTSRRLISRTGLNDAGQFAGAVGVGGQTRIFLFTPVPEPSAAGLAVCAVAGALLRRSRSGEGRRPSV